MTQIEYKGCIVSQSDYNNHVMIIRDGEMVLHSPVAEKKTEEELKMLVDSYFELLEKLGKLPPKGE
jgi:hypothetical protein